MRQANGDVVVVDVDVAVVADVVKLLFLRDLLCSLLSHIVVVLLINFIDMVILFVFRSYFCFLVVCVLFIVTIVGVTAVVLMLYKVPWLSLICFCSCVDNVIAAILDFQSMTFIVTIVRAQVLIVMDLVGGVYVCVSLTVSVAMVAVNTVLLLLLLAIVFLTLLDFFGCCWSCLSYCSRNCI